MKSIFIYIGILLYLFITPSTAGDIGIQSVGTASCAMLMTLFIFEAITNNKVILKLQLKEELAVIIIFIVYAIIQYSLKRYLPLQSYFFFIIVPVLISILVKVQDRSVKKNIFRLVVFFLFAEFALALFERIFKVNVFPYETKINIEEETWLFRSSAFLGHPLINAICVSIILGFIIISQFNKTVKLICLGCGFTALLFFNARGAIIIWSLIGMHYLYTVVTEKKRTMLSTVLVFLAIALFFSFIFYLVFYTSLGGRIMNQDKVLDGSAMTRFQVFNAFDFISGPDLLMGNPANYKVVSNALHAGGVENPYIVILIDYGIIAGVLLMVALFFLVKKYISPYNIYGKIIVLLSFIVVGSFNPSIADVRTTWALFFICANTFSSFEKTRTVKVVYTQAKRNTII